MLRRAFAWLLLLMAAPAAAQTLPPFTGEVVDAANVLPPAVEADLAAKLQSLRHDTQRQLVVATVPSLQGYPIEEYGNKLIRGWGVGLKDVNNGAILLIAPNERKVRVEVGYGLEPVLTDALSSVVINQDVLPRFKAGDLPGGVTAGADALIAQLRAAPEEQKARADTAAAAYNREHRSTSGGGDGGVPITLIFWGVVFLFFILPALARGRRGQRWSGGGSSGGSAWPIVLWSVANEIGRESRGGGGWGSGGGSWGNGDSGGGGGWGGDFGGGGGGSGGGGGASGSW